MMMLLVMFIFSTFTGKIDCLLRDISSKVLITWVAMSSISSDARVANIRKLMTHHIIAHVTNKHLYWQGI